MKLDKEQVKKSLVKTAVLGTAAATAFALWAASAKGVKNSEDKLNALAEEKKGIISSVQESSAHMSMMEYIRNNFPQEVQDRMNVEELIWEKPELVGAGAYAEQIEEVQEATEKAQNNRDWANAGMIVTTPVIYLTGIPALLQPLEMFDKKQGENEDEMMA